MAPIKFEDNIREQLQERELQPSEKAWERLESRLGGTPKKGLNQRGWLAIAASFVGILILASIYWNDSPEVNGNELVIDTMPSEETSSPLVEETEKAITPDEVRREIAVEALAPAEKDRQGTIKEKESEMTGNKTNKSFQSDVVKSVLAKNDVPLQEKKGSEKEEVREFDEKEFINIKVGEVVADVRKLETPTILATPEEIDALLIAAQREIANNRILNSETQKVDAAALLMDVEFELERSFRDKVFDALGEGYKKIRTAVAERNY